MEKVTVNAVFQAWQIIMREREKSRDNYGQALVACAALEKFLGNCQEEIELPKDTIPPVVALLNSPQFQTTVSEVFKAYQTATRMREEARDKKGNYGQALVTYCVLESVLKDCKTEIFLPTNAIFDVVPFLSILQFQLPKTSGPCFNL